MQVSFFQRTKKKGKPTKSTAVFVVLESIIVGEATAFRGDRILFAEMLFLASIGSGYPEKDLAQCQ